MKKIIFSLFVAVSFVTYGQGNSGLGFNYQAVVRGADGFVLPKQNVELRFSLMPGQQATQASWIETHNVTTDAFGTIGVTVGKGTKVGSGKETFAEIVNFAAIHYWLKVEIKEGSSYRELSYTALASVPYSEVATNAVSSPVGSVMPFAGDASKVPAGWLLCDGSAVSRSEYAALYAVISTDWGFGNNSTTFNLPDMRGMFLRGVTGSSTDDADAATRVQRKEGGNSGNKVGSYQGDAIRNITGYVNSIPNGKSGTSGAFYRTVVDGNGNHALGGENSNLYFDASKDPNVNVGSDNRPKNVYVNYIIKY